MTYQEAVDYINKHGKELSHDKEKGECIVYIAPTDPKQLEEFNRMFVLNSFDQEVIKPFIDQDLCVMRGYKRGIPDEVLVYERVAV